jgi:uncharacterized protein (TIGR04255 family)
MSPESVSLAKLPNAPLTEVVFELRWMLEGNEPIPLPFRNDPGYYVMADRFADIASQHGFSVNKKMSPDPQSTAYSISWRFYKGQEQSFPLWQIGPGILAVNESASYEWTTYKKLCLDAVRALIRCYPRMRRFNLKPIHLELRYLDSFGLDEKANENLSDFLTRNTVLKFDLPNIVPGKLKDFTNGQLILNFPVKGMAETFFVVAIGSGISQGIKSVIMESKLITKPSGGELKQGQSAVSIGQWLENAHGITSPFFKEFIKEQLMQKFSGS